MHWRFVPLAALAIALTSALVAAPSLAQTPPGTTTPSPAATTPAPAGTPWPAPTGISLETSVTVTNPDGSFIPPELRTATNTITWDVMPGFTGVYEIQRSQSPRGATQPRAYTQLNVIPAANAASGKLRQADLVQFLDQLNYEFCYRVRTVINGETGPFTPEVCTIAPPSTGPGTPPRTSVPGHPLQVLYGPQPPGTGNSFADPDVSGLPRTIGIQEVRQRVPQAFPSSLAGYWVSHASAQISATAFHAQANYRGEGDRLLILRSWTKVGEFVITVPANSPVTDVQQTQIEGLAALTLLPTPAVVGGIGPRSIYLTDGKTIWFLELSGYSDNAEALALAAEVARAVRAPGPPGTGTSRYTSNTDSNSLALVFAAFALAAGFASLTLAEWRRRSR